VVISSSTTGKGGNSANVNDRLSASPGSAVHATTLNSGAMEAANTRTERIPLMKSGEQ
jgi:hypothetical protein